MSGSTCSSTSWSASSSRHVDDAVEAQLVGALVLLGERSSEGARTRRRRPRRHAFEAGVLRQHGERRRGAAARATSASATATASAPDSSASAASASTSPTSIGNDRDPVALGDRLAEPAHTPIGCQTVFSSRNAAACHGRLSLAVPDDALHVVGGQALELGRVALGAREVERVHVHVRRRARGRAPPCGR